MRMIGRWSFILCTMVTLCIISFSSICAAETTSYLDRTYRAERAASKAVAAPPRIAVVIAGDPHLTAEERIVANIEELLDMKFPSNAFAVVFDPAVETAMYELLEDRHGSMVPGNSPTEESPAENPYINHPTNQPIQFLGEQIQLDSLTKSDLVTIGKKHGYDYILFLPFYLAYEYSKTTWVTSFRKTAIVLRAKMVDVKRANYLLRKDFVQIGDSGTVFPSLFGISSLTRTARKAMNRCLLQSLNEIPIGEEIDIPQNELDYGDKW